MDQVKQISIDAVVIHVLENTAEEPILNEYTLEINEEIYKFVYTHVNKVLKDNNLRYAVFNSKEDSIKDISQEYLHGEKRFVETSKVIAEKLFSLMKSIGNVPSCDLMVVSISTEYGPMLGVLRLDYIKNYTHQIDFKDDSIGINITPIHTGLPTNKKVKKAAFIKQIKDDQEYDIYVLDKDYVKESDEYGANYFVNNLLGCTVIETNRDKTSTLINAAEIWTRSNIQEDAAGAERIRSIIKDALKNNDEINIYDLAEKIFSRDQIEARKSFAEFLQVNNLEEFTVDKELLNKKLDKIKMKIGNQIELSLPYDAYEDINRFEIVDNFDGSIHMIIKNIDRYIEK